MCLRCHSQSFYSVGQDRLDWPTGLSGASSMLLGSLQRIHRPVCLTYWVRGTIGDRNNRDPFGDMIRGTAVLSSNTPSRACAIAPSLLFLEDSAVRECPRALSTEKLGQMKRCLEICSRPLKTFKPPNDVCTARTSYFPLFECWLREIISETTSSRYSI